MKQLIKQLGFLQRIIIGSFLLTFLLSAAAFGYDLHLKQGRNFISLPIVPANSNIQTILLPKWYLVKDVWEFDPSDSADVWKHYRKGLESYCDLSVMTEQKGYWVVLIDDTTLPVTGTARTSNLILNLKQGVNIIPWPYLSSKNISYALSELVFGTDYSQISRFNPQTQVQENFFNNPALNNFSTFDSGFAYYIWMNKDKTVTLKGLDNRPPVLDIIGNKTVDENQTLTFTLSATDADGDTLTYSATGLPTGATFDPATKTFSWTPTYS